MTKIIELIGRALLGLFVLIAGFFIGWLLRGVKAKRQAKTTPIEE